MGGSQAEDYSWLRRLPGGQLSACICVWLKEQACAALSHTSVGLSSGNNTNLTLGIKAAGMQPILVELNVPT